MPTFQEVAKVTRRIDIIDGDTYVSFNAVHPPRPPRSGLFRFSYPERCYAQAQWFTGQFPFMAFCVKYPEWTGLFSCLAGTRNSFPVDETARGYELDPKLQHAWWHLEQSIIGSCEILINLLQKTVHSLDINVYSLPQSWGFKRAHKTEEDARIRILNSRNSFIPLMALFAYLAATHMHHFPSPDNSTPLYIRNLTESFRVDEQWMSDLAMHNFGRPATPRVGVYIDWPGFVPTNVLQYCVRYRVPVWVRLPGPPPHPPREIIPTLVVSKAEFEAAKAKLNLSRNPRPARLATSSSVSSTVATSSSLPTRRAPIARFRERDSILGHIGRYWEERLRTIEGEKPEETASRLLRELTALQYQCPESDGAYVFEWEKNSPTGWTRVYVTPERLPQVWAAYANSQKYYNSIHDEWDLSTELDPDATVDNVDDSDSGIPPYEPAIVETIRDTAHLSRSIVEEKYPWVAPETHGIHVASIDEVLFMVYGFQPDGNLYQPPSELINIDRIPRVLVEARFSPEGHDKTTICHFVSSYIKGSQFVPGPLHDLHPDNEFRLRFRNPPTFQIAKSEDNLYILKQPSQSSLRIYVPHPSLVVQTLRIPTSDTLEDIAQLFCAKGSPFYFADTIVSNPFQALPIRVSGLGFRQRGFRPTWVDYQAYVDRRARLLSNPAIARAALMQGGIIWRLTVDALRALHGSVNFEAYFTQAFETVHLTLHDLGIIVGLYRIWSGMSIPLHVLLVVLIYSGRRSWC